MKLERLRKFNDNIDICLKPDFRLVYATHVYKNYCVLYALSSVQQKNPKSILNYLNKYILSNQENILQNLDKLLEVYIVTIATILNPTKAPHPPYRTHYCHCLPSSSPKPTSLPVDIVNLSSQAPLAISSAPPTVIHTTTAAAAIMAIFTISASKITGVAYGRYRGSQPSNLTATPLPQQLALPLPTWLALLLLTSNNSFSKFYNCLRLHMYRTTRRRIFFKRVTLRRV